MNTNNSKID